jgi:hypothetical protein
MTEADAVWKALGLLTTIVAAIGIPIRMLFSRQTEHAKEIKEIKEATITRQQTSELIKLHTDPIKEDTKACKDGITDLVKSLHELALKMERNNRS